MTKTLQSALAPLFIVGSFCCLGLFEYPLGHPRPYLSCLYILTVWSNIIYFIYFPIHFYQYTQTTILNFVNLNEWITISLILINFYRFKELKICLHELSIINDTLEALGTPKEYQQLRKWIIRIIISSIIYVFAYIGSFFYIYYIIWQNVIITRFGNVFRFSIFNSDYIIILSTLICGSVLRTVYHLFRSMAHALAEEHNSYEDIEKWVSGIAAKDESFFRRGTRLLPERWEKIIVNDGQYFD